MPTTKDEWENFIKRQSPEEIDITNFKFDGEDGDRGTRTKTKDDQSSETGVPAHKQGQKELSERGGLQGKISGDDEFFWISAKHDVYGTENSDDRPRSQITFNGKTYTVRKVDTQDQAVHRIHAQVEKQ